MTHLAIYLRLTLAVEMYKNVFGIILVQPVGIGGTIARAQNIDHNRCRIAHLGWTKREISDGAQVLGKLRGVARLDGVVAEIMRTWRDLVQPELALFIKKQLNTKDTNYMQ